MSLGSHFTTKRTRESTSKVRTGCFTCKARRVKCDETKPVCQRCAKGDRECIYHTTQAVTPRNVITIYLPPTQSQPAFFLNDRGLDYFHRNLAPKLDGQFDSKFWKTLVLQLSHSESSIRHAVSAISVVYQDVESSLQHPTGYVNANPEAQHEWHKAVKSLSARINENPDSTLVPMTCCLLFTCIEFLRGNVESSMLHVQSGLSILAELRRNNENRNRRRILSLDDIRAIEYHVAPMFARLSVLCSLAGRESLSIQADAAKENSYHEDLTDSRQRLSKISDICVQFIRKASMKATIFQIDVEDLIEQIKLETKLDAWYDQLHELSVRTQASGNCLKQDAVNLLLIHYKVIYIWLRVCVTAGESATDSYYPDFEELVQCVEHIVKPDGRVATPQPLSFDMHVTGPLYYTVLKCRHPTLRRRALELLRLAPRREGLWNAHYAYVTSKRIIELEERHLNEHGWPEETSRLHGLPLPDDESRIYNSGKAPSDFTKSDHGIVLSPTYPGSLEAVFQMKPWGLSGQWQTITECIEL